MKAISNQLSRYETTTNLIVSYPDLICQASRFSQNILIKNFKGGVDMKATKIRMKSGCQESNNPREIDSIYLEEVGIFYKKETVYDYLLKNPKSIYVNIYPYPILQPAVSVQGEKICSFNS